MLEPVRPEAVSPDRAFCLPTFSHFLIVNNFLSLSLLLENTLVVTTIGAPVCERNDTSPRCQGSDPRGNGQDERRRQEEDQCQLCANTALDSGPPALSSIAPDKVSFSLSLSQGYRCRGVFLKHPLQIAMLLRRFTFLIWVAHRRRAIHT